MPNQTSASRARVMATGKFEFVEPDYIVHATLFPSDAGANDSRLWGLRNAGQSDGVPGADIGAPAVWDITTGSSSVIVAVIDSGIRYSHQDLAANMWRNPGEIAANGIDDDHNGYVDDIFGINSITGSGDPFDDNSHGTHVAGTIGAVANGGGPHVGVAWNVSLIALKFLGANGSGELSDAIECIDYAISKGAMIMNNSWGGGGFSSAMSNAIERARLANSLFVAAAGNNGSDNDAIPAYPASYPQTNIVAVAALDRRARRHRRWCARGHGAGAIAAIAGRRQHQRICVRHRSGAAPAASVSRSWRARPIVSRSTDSLPPKVIYS